MIRQDPLYQIRGTSAEPLSFADEMTFLRRWKKRKCRHCRDRLIKNYLLYSAKIAKRFYPHLTNSEMVSIANVAVLESIEKFDVDRGKLSRLSTIIPFYVRINHTRLMCERPAVKLPVKKAMDLHSENPPLVSLDAGFETHRTNGELSAEVVEALTNSTQEDRKPFEEVESSAQNAQVAELLKKMPVPLRRVLRLVYFQNLSFAEVARRSSPPVTREAVRQRHVKAMRLFKEILAEHGITSL